ncbi:MAG: hypothetical protein IT379_09790, partial [Deltaproteobacteria bacterium]|nr:hypothetical protein [Deltaproteobacteria bacterium]
MRLTRTRPHRAPTRAPHGALVSVLVALLVGATACGDDDARVPRDDAGDAGDASMDAGMRDDAATARSFVPTPPDVP